MKNFPSARTPFLVKLAAVLVFVLLIISAILFHYHTVTYGPSYPPDTPLANTREELFKIVDAMNPSSSEHFLGVPEDIREFDVDLSKENLEYIDEVIARGLDTEKNIYQPVGQFISVGDNNFSKDTKTEIKFEGETYKGKIKIHGVWYPNYKNEKKSYSIKFKKDQLVENMRKVSFAVPEKQFIGGLMTYEISEKYGYTKAGYGIARLKFNGVDQGLYFLEESLGKELLEKNGMSGHEIVKSMDEWSYQYRFAHYMPTVFDLSYRDYENISGRDNGQLLLYDELLHADDYESIVNRIDLDKFARHEAMRTLFATYHCIEGDNLALVLNSATGRFFPYFRPEGFITRLEPSALNQSFDQNLYGRYLPDGTRYSENPLFTTLIRNDEFRSLRNKYLYQIVTDSSEILETWKSLAEKYQGQLENDSTNNYSRPYYRYRTRQQGRDLAHNLTSISKYLNYARVHVSLIQESANKLHLSIKPDSNSALAATDFAIEGLERNAEVTVVDERSVVSDSMLVGGLAEYFSTRRFMASLDDRLQPEVTSFDFGLIFAAPVDVNGLKVGFVNLTTGKAVKDKNVFMRVVRTPKKFALIHDLSKASLAASGLRNFSVGESEITLRAGRSEVREDIVLPHSYALRVESGAQIDIAADTSIVVNGGLIIDGSEIPVIIRNLEASKPFGVFAAVGDGSTTVDIKGLEISGGSEDQVNGMFLSGALSLYNHDLVKITDSHVHHNRADDGLNVKEAKFHIENNIFSNNYADQVDIDVATGTVLNNRFLANYASGDLDRVDIPIDRNGDGLDFSESQALVRGNTFDGFQDKGISVGERSQILVYENRFEHNRSAITAKDQSDVYLCENNFGSGSNEFAIEGYQKKPIFTHPSIYALCQDISTVEISLSKETKLYLAKGNESSKSEFVPSRFTAGMFKRLEELPWEKR